MPRVRHYLVEVTIQKKVDGVAKPDEPGDELTPDLALGRVLKENNLEQHGAKIVRSTVTER